VIRLIEKNLKPTFIFIIATLILFLIISPKFFRFSDDLWYLISAKTIVETRNLVSEKVVINNTPIGTPIYAPPLLLYVLSGLYVIFSYNPWHWFLASRLFEFLCFFGSLVLLYKICNLLKLSKKGKIVALLFFSFLPMNTFVSISVMQDAPLIFLMLLLYWYILKKGGGKSLYLKIFIVSGLLSLTKYSAVFVGIGAILSILLMKKSRNEKILLSLLIVLGFLVFSGWWYYRNYLLLGNPFFFTAASKPSELIKLPEILSRIDIFYDEYVHIFGLPQVPTMKNIFGSLSDSHITAIRILFGLFFLPIFVLFFKNWYTNRKKYRIFSPMFIIFFGFTFIYLPFIVGWVLIRYFLPALPFFAILLGNEISKFKNKIIISYFALCIISFLVIITITQYLMLERENRIVSSLNDIFLKYPFKNVTINRQDSDLIQIVDLVYEKNITFVEEIDCETPEKFNFLFACPKDDSIIIYRDWEFLKL